MGYTWDKRGRAGGSHAGAGKPNGYRGCGRRCGGADCCGPVRPVRASNRGAGKGAAGGGKKLLATGNGTCNLTNLSASPARYHGKGAADFVRPVLEAYPPRRIMRFFEELGLVCQVREDGRVYPRTAQASAVLDCLRLALSAAGAEERTGCPVTAIRRTAGGFRLDTGGGVLNARLVLVGAGGAAAPRPRRGTDGYTLLTALGHTRTPLSPSIVQVKTDPAAVRAIRGSAWTPPFPLPGRPGAFAGDRGAAFYRIRAVRPGGDASVPSCRGLGAEEGWPDDSGARSAA